jgi:hypothetical protein
MKTSWTPISPSGFQPLTQAELAAHFVDDFEAQHQPYRRRLLGRLRAYLAELTTFGLPMEIWLDGSFTTRCPEPEDVDLVVLLANQHISGLNRTRQERLSSLLNERELVRIRYTCDVYYIDPGNTERRQYWTRQFASNHDDTPKGIFTLTL